MDVRPIMMKPMPLAKPQREWVLEEFQRLERLGVVEEVVVGKKG